MGVCLLFCMLQLPVEMNNPADTIMDILVNETAQEEIVCYYKLSHDADTVRKDIKATRRTASIVPSTLQRYRTHTQHNVWW